MSKGKLKNAIKKVGSLKETILISVVVIAAVVYVAVSSFEATGFFVTSGQFVSGNELKTAITAGSGDLIELNEVQGEDTVYSRWGNIYAGDEKKTKVNTEFPMYTAGGAGIRFFNNGSILLNDRFGGIETYDGLIVNGGTSFNTDGSQADLDSFILAKLSNGLYINTQTMEIETIVNKYIIPANSILLIKVDRLAYYTYRSGLLVPGEEIPDLSLAATVRIGGLEMSYKEFLIKLQIYEEPAETGAGKQEEPSSLAAASEGELSGENQTAESFEQTAGDMSDTDKDKDEDEEEQDPDREEGEGEGVYGEGIAEGEAEADAGNAGGGKKKKSSKSGGGSSGGGGAAPEVPSQGAAPEVPSQGAPAERPAAVEKPSDVPPAEEPETVPDTDPAEPEHGKKTPPEHPKVPPGAKENPDWKDPVVTAGSVFEPGIYTLLTSVTINDPANVLVNGVTYEVVIMNDYGKMTTYKRVSVRQQEPNVEQKVLISGLKPDSRYSITGTYRYMDKYGKTVTESRTFFATREFKTKGVDALGPIKVDDLELYTAEIYSNKITIPNIQFTDESDQDAIGSLAKASVRLNEGKSSALGDPLSSTATEKLKSYQPITYSSPKTLEPAQQYTINFLCYDQFYNQLRVEDADGNTQWTTKTCYELPKANITIENNAKDATVSIKIQIVNPAKLDYTDLKLRVMKTGKMGEKSEYIKLDGEKNYLMISDGQTVTIPSPGSNQTFVASVWCFCDNGDGTYQKEEPYERSIGTKKFTTSDLAELGALYLDVHNVTEKTIADEAEKIDDIKLKEKKLREISTRAVLTLQLNTTLTNPALYNKDLDLVNIVTMKLSSGAEKYQISLKDDELDALLSGEILTIDTNDTVRFPYLSGGLTSNTNYTLSMSGVCWFDDEGKETVDIRVSPSISSVKTAMRSPEVILNDASVGFYEGFIYMDIRITDLDNVIDGESAILSIFETDSKSAVGSFRIEKNKDSWFQLRLTSDPATSTGGTAYNIKANMMYTCSFYAEEAHTDKGYQTNYEFYSFDKGTGNSLTGRVFSLGLTENDPEDEKYKAAIGYELNVPSGIGTTQGKIYIDEYRNTRDITGKEVKTLIGTRDFEFGEKGLHAATRYKSVEYLTDYSCSESELQEGLQNGTVGEYQIPERYLVCEYIEGRGKTYFDTGYHPNQSTGVVSDVFLKGWIDSSYGAVYGINDGSWGGKSYGLYFGGSSWSNYNNDVNLGWGNIYGKRYLFRRDANKLYRNNTLVRTDNASKFEPSKNQNLFINAINWGGAASYFILQKIYEFKIYDAETLVRDFIPVYDTLESRYGLWDAVEGKYYESKGLGSFTGEVEDCRYYRIEGQNTWRLTREYVPCSFTTQVEKDNIVTDTYSYEMYFIYLEGTEYAEKVPLSHISFSTEAEILTIATGDEFITKGANAKKYVVIDDIEYDNRDVSSSPLGTFKANVDFQGFSFTTYVNYAAIVNTSTRSASISNMVLKSTAGLLSVAGVNSYAWTAAYRGGCLFSTWYGSAENLYVEFRQEEFPYIYNKGTLFTYWSTLSPEEFAALPNDETRNKYKYRIQPVVSSFVCDNYGTIENFVVDLQTEIAGNDWVGGICCGNVSGGVIRSGYAFSSYGASIGNYTGKMSLFYGYSANGGSSTEGAVGGICSYVNTNAVLENCYSLVDVTTYANKEVSNHAGSVCGMTRGSTARVYNCYGVGNLLYKYNDETGAEVSKVLNTGFGPAIGRQYSGSRIQNIYYLSDYLYSNSQNTQLSNYALKSKEWQKHILNSNGTGFVIDDLVDVGFYPQVNYTAVGMPTQHYIPLPGVSLVQNKTDVAYAYDFKDGTVDSKVREVIESSNYGNEAWDFTESFWTEALTEAEQKDADLTAQGKTPHYVDDYNKLKAAYYGKDYYNSNDEVLCILLAESDQTRWVYSIEVENFQLTHEDILYQRKDGTGIISVYVRMHNPKIAVSQYKIVSVTYEKLEGAGAGGPGDKVVMNGSRYANAEFYKRIWTEKNTSPDSWEAMIKKYPSGTFTENMVLKKDMNFAGMGAKSLLIRGTYSGKLNGAGFTISNIDYDPSLAATFGFTGADNNMGLINTLTGSVKNLTMDNVHFEGGANTGAVCASMSGGDIDHVLVKNSYIAGGRLLGGLAALADGGNILNSGIQDSKLVHSQGVRYTGVDANGSDYFTGGIVGHMKSAKVQNSFVQNAYIESMYVDFNTCSGGIAGYLSDSYSYMDGCYATGTMHTNNDYTGGLIGVTRYELMSFTNCYADMDIYSYNYCAEPLVGMYINRSTALPASVVSFGSVLQAVDFERGADDERTASFHPQPFTSSYQKSVPYSEYTGGGLFSYLSADYFSTSVDYANGELPKVLDTSGALITAQKTEYLGQDYAAERTSNKGIAVDSSSLKLTQTSADTYDLELTVHHTENVSVTGIYFGFDYVDSWCGMQDKSGKIMSFTDTAALKNNKSVSIYRPDANTSVLMPSQIKVDAAYDRYFITAVSYVEDGETRYQRVGIPLTSIPRQWKSVGSAAEWEAKVFGTHCENFQITGDINFASTNIYWNSNTANNIVNRVVGVLGTDAEDYAYRGSGNAGGTNPYATVSNLTLNDSDFSVSTAGMWQRMYCRGLISVVNSEIGYLTFEHVNAATKYGNFGVIGALTGHGHHLNLNDVHISDTIKNNVSYTGFIAFLKDGVDHVYMNNCHIDSDGSSTSALVAYLHPYTHNNFMKDIYAENCSGVVDCDNADREVTQGIVLGCTYRSWGLRCSYKAAASAANVLENITVTKSTSTADGYNTGMIAGVAGGYMKNCTVTDCTVLNTSYISGGVMGSGHWIHADNVTVDHVTVTASGRCGGIAGRSFYYDGGVSEHSAYFRNCEVKNTTVKGVGYVNREGYLWYVGAVNGYFESSSNTWGFIGNKVQNCTVIGASGMVGGVNGYSYWGCRYDSNTVTDTYVQGNAEVGGVHGGSNDNQTSLILANKVERCEITGTRYVGGLIGYGGLPYRSNQVIDSIIMGTEYDIGGAVGIISHNNQTGHTEHYSRQNNGYYSTLVKNCYIYGRYYVGGGVGSIYRVGNGSTIVEDCEVRGYYGVGGIAGRSARLGTDNAADEIYYYPYDSYVTDTLVTEMDEEANEDLRAKFDRVIEPTVTRAYFGGITGYCGTMWYCLADSCVIAAPNSDYVGCLAGYYYITWRSSYSDSCYSSGKDCVVIGRDYVGGLYGGLRAGYNQHHVIETERISASYSYSNAHVTGENHVAGIAGSFAADNEEGAKTFNPQLTGLYFTGSLNATGTGSGSGIVASFFAEQSINHRMMYNETRYDKEGKPYVVKVEKDDYFRMDGVISMPSSMTGYRVYPVLNNSCASNFEIMCKGEKDVFLTLWNGTQITENGTARTMQELLNDPAYQSRVFGTAAYDAVISGGKRTDDPRFILLLDAEIKDPAGDIYQKAFRSDTVKNYTCGKAFKNITEAEAQKLMPLCNNGTSVYPFGKYALTVGETSYSISQGVPIPGSEEAAIAETKQQTVYDEYINTGEWTTGGTSDVEKLIRKYADVYPSAVDKVNVEFAAGFYTADLGNSVHITSASFRVTKDGEGYYSKVKTEEMTAAEAVTEATAKTLTYNFVDNLTVNVDYKLSDGRTGTIGVLFPAESIRDTLAGSYEIIDGSVWTVGSDPVVKKHKEAAPDYQFPDADYTPRAFISAAGNSYIDTGVLIPETEIYLDFLMSKNRSTTFLLGRDTPDHDCLIGFNASGNGFGYFGSLLWNNFGYATGLVNGSRYMLHVVGKTGDLRLDMLNKSAGQTSYKNYYSNVAYNAYLSQVPEGVDPKNYTYYLGGAYWQGFEGQIYGMKMYHNGLLVRDFIPVTKNAGTVAGLYDLVEGEFYSSKTGKAFGAPLDGAYVERGKKEYIHLFTEGTVTKVIDARGNISDL